MTSDTANRIVAQLLFLEAEDSENDIAFYINCPGGYVSAGLAIYDTMQYLKAPIQTICIGQASSMGAILLASGNKGKRFALPHSRVMIHQPSGGFSGQAEDIDIQAKEILRTTETLNGILARHTGQSVRKIAKDTQRDYFFSTEEAKKYGIIDSVMHERKLQAVS